MPHEGGLADELYAHAQVAVRPADLDNHRDLKRREFGEGGTHAEVGDEVRLRVVGGGSVVGFGGFGGGGEAAVGEFDFEGLWLSNGVLVYITGEMGMVEADSQ